MAEAFFVFPGNGVHSSAYYERQVIDTSENQYFLDLMNKHAGYDLAGLMLDKKGRKQIPDEKGRQLATVGASVLLARELEARGLECVGRSGLSLGANSATSPCLEDEALLYLVAKRAEAMEKCVPVFEGQEDNSYMAVIANLSRWRIKSICRNVVRKGGRGHVDMANWNIPNQIVISGAVPAVKKVINSIERKYPDAEYSFLPTGGPWHNGYYMGPASGEVAKVVKQLEFKKPRTNIYLSGLNGFVSNPEDAGSALSKEISSRTCFWKDIWRKFQSGYRTFIDVGPGRVMDGLLSKFPNITILKRSNILKENKKIKSLEQKVEDSTKETESSLSSVPQEDSL